MSKKRLAAIFLIAALSLTLALPVAAADASPGTLASLWNAVVEVIGDLIGDETEAATANDDEDGLPNVSPVVDPNG